MLTINIHEYFKFQRNSNFPFSRWNMKIARKLLVILLGWVSYIGEGRVKWRDVASPASSQNLFLAFYLLRLFSCSGEIERERRGGGKKVIKSFRVFWFWWVCSWSAFTLTFLWSPQKLEVGFSKQKLCKKHKKEMLAKDLYLCLIKMF